MPKKRTNNQPVVDSNQRAINMAFASLSKRGLSLDKRLFICTCVVKSAYYKQYEGLATAEETKIAVEEAFAIYNNPRESSVY